MQETHYPCVLTIAGTDPSGGAGIQADIKAISATGSYAASVITALVAQNTQGVQAIQEVPAEFVKQQLDSVLSDLNIQAVKIGMLHHEKIIDIIASLLKKSKLKNIVLDPVMVAKNGCELLPADKVAYLKNNLLSLVDLVTPNIFEAEKILGEKITHLTEMEAAAEKIGSHYGVKVLLKGGHLDSEQAVDVFYDPAHAQPVWFIAKRIVTRNTHGTGCTLSSAIASYLAQGYVLPEAIEKAKQYMTAAIDSGSRLHIGHGCGPVNHFYAVRL